MINIIHRYFLEKKRRAFLCKILPLVGFCSLSVVPMTFAQGNSVDKLRSEIRQAEEQIKRIDKLLKSNDNELLGTQQTISLVEQKIKSRKVIIRSMDGQIAELKKQLGRCGDDIVNQNDTLQRMVAEQSIMLRSGYMSYKLNGFVSFVFDSQSFQQANRRNYYLDQYIADVRRRIADIDSRKQGIQSKVEDLTQQEKQLKVLMADKASEVKALESEQRELDLASNRLKSNSAKLKSEAAASRKTIQQLQSKIQQIMEEEARQAALEAKRRQSQMGEAKAKDEYQAQGREFAKGKGVLLSPVQGGVVIEKFGVHAVPGQPGVKVDNKGVNIMCGNGASVRCVADGDVRRVFFVPGMGSSVIVRHIGGYLSVYSNLGLVAVKQGDAITRGSVLGQMGALSKVASNSQVLHFQIWKETQILDPELWVKF